MKFKDYLYVFTDEQRIIGRTIFKHYENAKAKEIYALGWKLIEISAFYGLEKKVEPISDAEWKSECQEYALIKDEIIKDTSKCVYDSCECKYKYHVENIKKILKECICDYIVPISLSALTAWLVLRFLR